ncbi:MAG: VanZ family protein [Myxococcota bacterium]|nr:VanZ family protein [Myxococcota bacterium]
MRSRATRRVTLAWVLAGAWAVLVWGLGSDSMGSPATSAVLGSIVEWLLPGVTPSEKWKLVRLLRKSAHVIEYAVLAGLVLRAARLSWKRSASLAATFALGVVVVLAIADETRQGLSAIRTGSAWDVALDVFGGLLAVGLGLAMETAYRRRRASRAAPAASGSVDVELPRPTP